MKINTTMNTVWVGSLPEGIAEAAVQNVFAERCGPVTTCSLKTKGTDTFAFIKFADPLGFEKALRMDQDTDAFGEAIKVNFTKNANFPTNSNWSADDEEAGKGGKGKGKGKDKGGNGWSKGGGKWDRNGGWEDHSWWDYNSNRNGHKGKQKGGNEGTEDPLKVWVGGLPKEMTQSELRSGFEKFGEIEDVKLVQKEYDTFAFITYREARHADAAIRKMHGSEEFGDAIKVNKVFVKHRPGGKGGDDRPSGGLRLRSRSARGNRQQARGESRTRERRPRPNSGVIGSDFVRRALGNSGAVERRARKDVDDDDVVERSEDGDRSAPRASRAPRASHESPRGKREKLGYGYGDGDDEEESAEEEEEEEDDGSIDDKEPAPRSQRAPPRVEAKPRKVSATTKKAAPRKAEASSRKHSDPRLAAARAAAAGGKADAESSESEAEEDDDEDDAPQASEGRADDSEDGSEAAPSDDGRAKRAPAPRRSSPPAVREKGRDREERRPSARDDDDGRRDRKGKAEAPSRGASRDRRYPQEKKRREDSRSRGTATSRAPASGRDRDGRRDDGRDREERDRRGSRGGREDDRDRERDRERDRDRGRGDDRSRNDRGARSGKDQGGRSRSAARRRPQQMVRVDNLPDDMTLDELRQTAEDFGQVVAVKISKGLTNGCRSGMIEFQSDTDTRTAVSKLDKRRVEGWEKRLSAYLVDA